MQVIVGDYLFMKKTNFDIEYVGHCVIGVLFSLDIFNCYFGQVILHAQKTIEHF